MLVVPASLRLYKPSATMLNAVDIDRIDRLAREPLTVPKRPGTFTLAHAGRFSRQKNQRMLLDAFASLRGRPAELWMLGEGKLRTRLEAHARRIGIQDQVRWLGFIDNPYPIFSAADAFVLSSDHEGLPNAVIEAMLCGTPAITQNCTAMAEHTWLGQALDPLQPFYVPQLDYYWYLASVPRIVDALMAQYRSMRDERHVLQCVHKVRQRYHWPDLYERKWRPFLTRVNEELW